MTLIFCISVVLISIGLTLHRVIKGPGVYDRILAANVFGTITVVLIALLSLLSHDMAYIDLALLYALINFIATIAFLKYFRNGSFKKEE
jgi:multicomponent Na+:H+ antiporter subunit F